MAERIIQVTLCDVAQDHQDEFNDWYNNTHLPEVLGCPGWRAATRFESLEGQPQFLAIYEVDGPDVWKTPEFDEVKGFGPVAPYILNVHPRFYREIFSAKEPS
jgi:hypothetical protein